MIPRTGFLSPSRLAGIDLARGLAIVGMLAAHLAVLPSWSWSDPATWGDVANGRSSILFATLAGVSLALMTGGRRRREGDAFRWDRVRIALRAVLIWMLGIALAATGVPVYVILPAYGVLFLLALPLLTLRPRTLFLTAAIVAVTAPFVVAWINAQSVWEGVVGEALDLVLGWHYPFVLWIAFVAAGIGVGRLDLKSVRVQLGLLFGGGALAALGYGVDASPLTVTIAGTEMLTADAHSSGVAEAIGSGGFALAVIGGGLLLCRTPLAWIVLPLRALGSMPLTAYSAQLIVWAVWAAVALGDTGDLTGFRDLHPFWPITVSLAVGCTIWALTIGRGPLELGVDRLMPGGRAGRR